ncbi:hypothetical protein BKA59DRAFT_114402 [Fusarium tricinctum]|uniref:Uncharacterized protein n=1 Tax=Fusarium tricinctum TaxID=61284 RepID=A0A8K0WGN0_9HYPO|nr:hypothetical protein BKA59DRAFT_114402 [Fusarium tricinctum]
MYAHLPRILPISVQFGTLCTAALHSLRADGNRALGARISGLSFNVRHVSLYDLRDIQHAILSISLFSILYSLPAKICSQSVYFVYCKPI